MKGRQRGFSLIELMVVGAVIVILCSVVTPTLVAALPSYHLRKTARQLCSHLRVSRSLAVKKNQKITVRFNTTARCYSIDTLGTFPLAPGISFGHGRATRPAGTKFPADGISFNSNRIVFNPRGIISSNSGYIYLQNQQQDTCVVGATTAGNISLKCWHGSWN